MRWLLSELCYVTAANQWTFVEIELLATVGWKCGCQPFSWPCSKHVTHCRTEICSTRLFKESIPAIPFWEFQASTPYQKQVPESGSTLHPLSTTVASCPSLRCNCRKKPLSCREAKGLVKKLWSPRFVRRQYSDWALSCLCDFCKPMNTCWDWAFSNSWLEVGLSAFQPPMFRKCDASPNRDLFDMFVQGIHSSHSFWEFEFQASTPCQKQVPESSIHSASSALCLHYACKRFHLVVEDSGFVSYAEKHMFGHGVVVSKVCYGIVECVFFPFAMSKICNVWRLSF